MTDAIILNIAGYGVAQSNVGPLGNILHVSVQEWYHQQDGEQIVTLDEIETNGVDVNGVETRDRLISTQTIHATWMPSGSNRFTAPNVRVGETVEILQQADTAIYYWRPMGLSEEHRKLETVIWGISATRDESADSLNPDNRYWIEFSSHSGKVILTTSVKNGEPVRYSFGWDTAKGVFNHMDSRGNVCTLESTEDRWVVATARNCKFTLDKKDLRISVPGHTEINTEGYTDIISKKGIKLNGGGSTATLDTSGIKLDGLGSTVDINPAGVFLKGPGSSLEVIAGGIFWSGAVFQKK